MATTVQDRKAPNAGTKVDLGRNAPVTLEGAGTVEPASLAAESQGNDGKFADNRRSEPESSSSNYEYTTASSSSSQPRHDEQAPRSNVSGREDKAQTLDAEGFDDPRLQDGLAKALNSEPGSIDDPSRLAEAQLKEADAANPSLTGLNQPQLSTGAVYDNLDREVPS
ncbi:hypothetical protein GQ602_003400 [Ophiocordyceps camponoti-floridani]|uniref:Uncharacterized protein n=1 Tax=Ophiocordyceps camponoti-floridani TaxID=2030778 RepID=A0A8H4Q850_9HYPO|nr:hypothetical protein GQ602_003400 [Ophiocordyceps camponoti-floridani]